MEEGRGRVEEKGRRRWRESEVGQGEGEEGEGGEREGRER